MNFPFATAHDPETLHGWPDSFQEYAQARYGRYDLYEQARCAVGQRGDDKDGGSYDLNVRNEVSAIRVAAGQPADAFLGQPEALRLHVTLSDEGVTLDLVVFEGEMSGTAAEGFAARQGLGAAATQQIADSIAQRALGADPPEGPATVERPEEQLGAGMITPGMMAYGPNPELAYAVITDTTHPDALGMWQHPTYHCDTFRVIQNSEDLSDLSVIVTHVTPPYVVPTEAHYEGVNAKKYLADMRKLYDEAHLAEATASTFSSWGSHCSPVTAAPEASRKGAAAEFHPITFTSQS